MRRDARAPYRFGLYIVLFGDSFNLAFIYKAKIQIRVNLAHLVLPRNSRCGRTLGPPARPPNQVGPAQLVAAAGCPAGGPRFESWRGHAKTLLFPLILKGVRRVENVAISTYSAHRESLWGVSVFERPFSNSFVLKGGREASKTFEESFFEREFSKGVVINQTPRIRSQFYLFRH